MRHVFTQIRRWCAQERGSSTIEFCIWFPFILGILGSAFEASFITTRQALLTSSVDRVVRDLTLGNLGAPSHSELKAELCNTIGVIPRCDESLHIELERISTGNFNFRQGEVACVDRDEDVTPPLNYVNGTSNDLMLMTVCAAIRPMIPLTGLGLLLPKIKDGNFYGLVSYAAFVVEPV